MKFLYGYFDQKTGKSTVALADKYGKYIGQSKIHPEDKNNSSEYMGCEIAQRRAWIKALQNKRYRAKIKLNFIKNLIKDIDTNYEGILHFKLKRRFNLKIRDLSNEIKDINNQIEQIKTDIKKRIELRDILIKKINKSNK